MNSAVPKQFLDLAGKPILLRTLERIASLDGLIQIVVTLPVGQIRYAQQMLQRQDWKIPVRCVRGGDTRQESVRRGLAVASRRAELVLVHDAVRPLCDRATMERTLEAAWRNGGAVPGLPATETIQRVSKRGRVKVTPPREELYAIQTPQCFRAPILREALKRARAAGFTGTDESSVSRWAGYPVTVVPGSAENIKVTRPLDLKVAELLLSGDAPVAEGGEDIRMRIGHGIDYHCLVEGRKLILGGVEIPFEKGLEGHSDADALSHAICDALLGAAALGDIGRHFPNTDPAQRNRNSLEFLREARSMLDRAGWKIINVDATMLAQRPKLAPFMPEMIHNLAEALGVDPGAVSVKATTTEGLNAEGRGEGISAQAVALLERK
jgi:2-C-methyl-D-erythritol 4-phosphate cytidylyltransferase/2-C-methyl-D-erythritol 2,4-cyclodiphosphate synthase